MMFHLEDNYYVAVGIGIFFICNKFIITTGEFLILVTFIPI